MCAAVRSFGRTVDAYMARRGDPSLGSTGTQSGGQFSRFLFVIRKEETKMFVPCSFPRGHKWRSTHFESENGYSSPVYKVFPFEHVQFAKTTQQNNRNPKPIKQKI